jgi:hypothetical protein
MTIFDLTLDSTSLSQLKPREITELCMVLSHDILRFIRDVPLVFHPLEQILIMQFLTSARRYFYIMLRSSAPDDPMPEIEVHNITMSLQNGESDNYELKMKTDVTSMVQAGPVILTKFIDILHKSIIESLGIDRNCYQSVNFMKDILEGWTEKSNAVLLMMERMCSQVSEEGETVKHKQSIITSVSLIVDILYD